MNGRWLPSFVPDPSSSILAVHAALVPSARPDGRGSIIFFSGNNYQREEHDAGRVDRTRIYDCAQQTVTTLPSPAKAGGGEPPDLFCCGHALAGDGRLLVIGGTHVFGLSDQAEGGFHHGHWPGLDTTFLFDPLALCWVEADRMPPPPDEGAYTGGRWYPTAVTLPSGDVLAMSGHPDVGDVRHNNNTPGVFRAGCPRGAQWCVFHLPDPAFELGVEQSVGHESMLTDRADREYPRAHLIPGGAVFCPTPLAPRFGPAATQMQVIDPVTGGRAFVGLSPAVPQLPNTPSLEGAEGIYNDYFGTSVLLPLLPEENYRARVLLFGGVRAWLVDLSAVTAALRDGSIQWNSTNPGTLAHAVPAPARTLVGRLGRAPIRRHAHAVILPTGQVFFTGGIDPEPTSPNENPDQDRWAVLDGEMYGAAQHGHPAVEAWAWTNISAADSGTPVVPRNYHSVALLMPDGRVWTAGSSKDHGAQHEPRMQVFEPWYVGEQRPAITQADEVIHYQRNFTLGIRHDRPIARVALVRCGSVTHGFNSDQRYVGLSFVASGASHLVATAPPGGDVAPPGTYLVFAIDDRGVPSEGRFVSLKWIPIPATRPSSSGFAVAPMPGFVEVFWVRPDGMVFTNARDPNINGGNWNNPIPIAPNIGSADINSGVAAVSLAPGTVEVFWIRPDGLVFTNARNPAFNEGRWNNPIPIAPNPGSADPRSGVAAVCPAAGIVEVFWVRPDGMVFTNARHPGLNGGRWNNPVPIAPNPGSADPRSGVAAVCPEAGTVEVFWVRPDGMVFTNARNPAFNGGNWNNPIPIAPNPGSADPRGGVAAVCPGPGIVEVFWVRPDGMVFTNARDPGINAGNWNNPIPIAPAGAADPRSGVAAVSPAPGIVEVFWVRPDGMVFTNARDPNLNGGNWNNPMPIAPLPGSADPRSPVAAVCPAAGIVEVFWIRPDGMVFTNARNPAFNAGKWNNPIPIAPAPGSAAIRNV